MEDLIKNTEFICIALLAIFIIVGFGLAIIIANLRLTNNRLKELLEDNYNIIEAIDCNTDESLQIKGHTASIMTEVNELNDKL